MKKKKITELTIQSVSCVHDPEAARKWMEIYVDLSKQELLKAKALNR